MGIPKGRRRVVVAVAAVLVAGLAALTVHRVLAPAQVSTVARGEYPPVAEPAVGVIGRFSTAPLVVDGRIRVYATTRQVWADEPVDDRQRNTPYWSYRRWPAQLAGVVAADGTVVSRWSDGRLVALTARSGRVAWAADGPRPEEGYAGRRTGAATVWAPPGLHTATTPGGRQVVVVVGRDEARGVDLGSGRELWRAALDGGCPTAVGTTVAGRLVLLDRCADRPAVEFRDVATGTAVQRWSPPEMGEEPVVVPVGCGTARSRCRGLWIPRAWNGGEDGVGRGWLAGAGTPTPAPGLDAPGTALAGEIAVTAGHGVVTGRSVRTGAQVWRRDDLGPAIRVLVAQPGRVHLLTEANDLVTLDPTDGGELSRFRMTVGRDSTVWTPGLAYAEGGYVAVERLREPVDPAADDQRYYLVPEPVVLAAS